MTAKVKKVVLELPSAHYKLISEVLQRNPWLGYDSIEEFLEEASRVRLEALLHLEALQNR